MLNVLLYHLWFFFWFLQNQNIKTKYTLHDENKGNMNDTNLYYKSYAKPKQKQYLCFIMFVFIIFVWISSHTSLLFLHYGHPRTYYAVLSIYSSLHIFLVEVFWVFPVVTWLHIITLHEWVDLGNWVIINDRFKFQTLLFYLHLWMFLFFVLFFLYS